jgi:galactosylceramide sulfotransferase
MYIQIIFPWFLFCLFIFYHFEVVGKLKNESYDYYQKKVFSELNSMKRLDTVSDTVAVIKANVMIDTVTEQPKCSRIHREIAFLKTHKTASETMAGIFRKFAIMNNVSTLIGTSPGGHMYRSGVSYYYYPIDILTFYVKGKKYAPINGKDVKLVGYGLPGAHFDLAANHMTWNSTFIANNFPKNTKKITILRNPATLFESSWKYYYILMKNPIWGGKRKGAEAQTKQLYELIESPNKFYQDALKMNPNSYRHILRTQLASFGFGDQVYDRDLSKGLSFIFVVKLTLTMMSDLVSQWIRQIGTEFDLVLIMEYFEYSLALLSIELCWPIEYVANIKMNEGKHLNLEKRNYHEELIRLINYPDFMLYDYFNSTFWKKVNSIGIVMNGPFYYFISVANITLKIFGTYL